MQYKEKRIHKQEIEKNSIANSQISTKPSKSHRYYLRKVILLLLNQ